ncbi:pyridoxamine 5'-phosphate oxidase family protein [Actinosynnema sp. NPDC020468]|uniref:pyridoxamine 5'-phosphate oxidase family protein n=1 Tax=Actinosynnema sp. NPDC020468 TaxID=3154488 RepID=UPI0033E5219B
MTVADVLADPISTTLLTSSIPARLAYVAKDGTPRVVPVAFLWTGGRLVVCTVPKSAKVAALAANPAVSLTIDTEGYPPKVLLIRGTAELTEVRGVPAEYVEASRKLVPEADFPGWEAGVRALYPSMVRITVTPTWAKLLDFERTIPKAVADLVAAHQAGA